MAFKHWLQRKYQWPINVVAMLPIASQLLVRSCYCAQSLLCAYVGPEKTPDVMSCAEFVTAAGWPGSSQPLCTRETYWVQIQLSTAKSIG